MTNNQNKPFDLSTAITDRLLGKTKYVDPNDFGLNQLTLLIHDQLHDLLAENYYKKHQLSILNVDKGDTSSESQASYATSHLNAPQGDLNVITIGVADYNDLDESDAYKAYHETLTADDIRSLEEDGIDIEPRLRTFKLTIEEVK